jgi:hypothetical protein
MSRYTFSRTSIYDEHFIVEAPSEAEARRKVENGDVISSQIVTWVDWQGLDYTLEDVEDELVRFINSKEQA